MLEVDVERRLGDFELAARFTAGPGITVLFGRSGAGKSSLVNMIAGLLRPDRGRIAVDDRVLFDSEARIDLPPHRRGVGYVFQESRLFPHLTVRQNLLYGRWFTPTRKRYTRLDGVVDLLGIGPLLKRRPGDLSGGEKQRVAIGRALLANPRLLLMDEPLASLDAERKAEILPYVERLRDHVGVPVVYVSHSVAEVARLGDTLVLMEGGTVVASGSAAELTSRPDLRGLADRFDAGAVIVTRVHDHDPEMRLTVLAFDGYQLYVPFVDLPPGAPVRVQIRARDVALAVRRPEGISILNVLPGRLIGLGPAHGAHVEVRVAVGSASILARITRRSALDLGLTPGMSIFAMVKSVALEPGR